MTRFDAWDLDYRPKPGDTTGPNMLKKALEAGALSWFDMDLDKKITRKAMPKTMREFAQLDQPLQSHLIAELWHPSRGLAKIFPEAVYSTIQVASSGNAIEEKAPSEV